MSLGKTGPEYHVRNGSVYPMYYNSDRPMRNCGRRTAILDAVRLAIENGYVHNDSSKLERDELVGETGDGLTTSGVRAYRE